LHKLPYVQSYVDRHGKQRHYFRRKGHPRVSLPGRPGTQQFRAAYDAAYDAVMAASVRLPSIRVLGADATVGDIINQYYVSARWRALKKNTQKSQKSHFEWIRRHIGNIKIRLVARKHIKALLQIKADESPGGVKNVLARLKMIFSIVVDDEIIERDPTQSIKPPQYHSEGHHTWTEDEIKQYYATHPVGTTARLAVDLLLYTGQRLSDTIQLGRQHVNDGFINLKQDKTNTRLALFVHPDLSKIIAASPTGELTFLVSKRGRPFSVDSFGKFFRRMCDRAGLPHCTAHGLRKAAARRLAEAGCTEKQIMSITGHKTSGEVIRYTAAASQRKLSQQAMMRTVGGTKTKRESV
jgi:integrase